MTHPAKHIARMAPYALSKFNIPKGKRLISLSQNESMRPPSPMIKDAVNRAIDNGALYPDPEWTDLRSVLAQVHGIDADAILCGTGSLDLISCLAHVFAGPTRSVLAPEHAYPFFRSAAEMSSARFDTAPEQNAVVDVDTLLKNVSPDTGIMFIANPANPTGTRIPKRELSLRHGGISCWMGRICAHNSGRITKGHEPKQHLLPFASGRRRSNHRSSIYARNM